VQIVLAVVLALMALSIMGCKGKELRKPVPSQMPGWCLRDSGMANDAERGRLAVGVGRVEGIKSPEMARVNVDGQARKQISQIFGRYVELLLAGYRAYTDADGESTDEDEVALIQRSLAKLNMRAGEIADRFTDTEQNIWYAVAVLPYEAFSTRILKSEDLPLRFKQFVKENAAGLFEKLPRHLPEEN
jgi:hypothetical protein